MRPLLQLALRPFNHDVVSSTRRPYICNRCYSLSSRARQATHSTSPKRALSTSIAASTSLSSHASDPSPRKLSAVWTPTLPPLNPPDPSPHNLLVRAGLVRQTHAGIFHTLPLGQRVQSKLEHLLDVHMSALGASRLALSSLSSEELWHRSGRLSADSTRSELFHLQDRRGAKLLLSPTHEEEITALAAASLDSYRDLPLRVYQVGRKYRDEPRARAGLLRAREFSMKDLYTFDADAGAALQTYEAVRQQYTAFFAALGLPVRVAHADSGAIGGDLSHEYHLASPLGEDQLLVCGGCGFAANYETLETQTDDASPACPRCHSQDTTTELAIELAHTFHLGTKYSAPLGAHITAPDGAAVPVQMGCHGIGVTRLIAAAAAHLADDRGLNWPRAIAPFEAALLAADERVVKDAETLRTNELDGVDAIVDDRAKGLAWKLKDADLIGYPVLLVLGRGWKEGRVEVQSRRLGVKREVPLGEVRATVLDLLAQL